MSHITDTVILQEIPSYDITTDNNDHYIKVLHLIYM